MEGEVLHASARLPLEMNMPASFCFSLVKPCSSLSSFWSEPLTGYMSHSLIPPPSSCLHLKKMKFHFFEWIIYMVSWIFCFDLDLTRGNLVFTSLHFPVGFRNTEVIANTEGVSLGKPTQQPSAEKKGCLFSFFFFFSLWPGPLRIFGHRKCPGLLGALMGMTVNIAYTNTSPSQ